MCRSTWVDYTNWGSVHTGKCYCMLTCYTTKITFEHLLCQLTMFIQLLTRLKEVALCKNRYSQCHSQLRVRFRNVCTIAQAHEML
jgi:hypothetical protein